MSEQDAALAFHLNEERFKDTSAKYRKDRPLFSGVLNYFPDALLEVAYCSKLGNDQHNPGQKLHWAKEKSTDHPDALARHLLDHGTLDTDGVRHSAKAAWRALALLQTEIDREKADAKLLNVRDRIKDAIRELSDQCDGTPEQATPPLTYRCVCSQHGETRVVYVDPQTKNLHDVITKARHVCSKANGDNASPVNRPFHCTCGTSVLLTDFGLRDAYGPEAGIPHVCSKANGDNEVRQGNPPLGGTIKIPAGIGPGDWFPCTCERTVFYTEGGVVFNALDHELHTCGRE